MAVLYETVGVSYSEVRDWSWWLQIFTAQDIADAMGVDREIGERAIKALLWHGICERSGATDSRGDDIITYVPLPAGPNEHPTKPPEWATCEVEILCPRGLPVRIRSDRDTRRKMAGDMSARHRLKQQERNYQKMMVAKEERAQKQSLRTGKLPKWMRQRSAI